MSGSLAMPALPARDPSLTRSVVVGILILSGSGTAGQILKSVPGLSSLGHLLVVLSWLAVVVATVVGAGAWLTSEARTGLIARIWNGRRGSNVLPPPAPVAPPSPIVPPAPEGAV
jgi:hypothetical protein